VSLAHFYDLTYDDIVNIHNETIAQFSTTSHSSSSKIHRGVLSKGTLEAIVERPSQGHYNHTPFPDIYSKCASLMEAIIQWHPFFDGNKRTGLAVACSYMRKNSYYLVLPISAIRFSVLIANKEKTFEDIKKWVKKHTGRNVVEYYSKFRRYRIDPSKKVLKMLRSGDPATINRGITTTNEWLAIDIYPEYEMDRKQTLEFLTELIKKYSPPTAPPPPPPPPS
jgi:death-on-curing protein